jgi:hypothetical protein
MFQPLLGFSGASAFSVCSAVKFKDMVISLEKSTVPLTRMVRRKKFDTRGDAIITAIRNLREWQFQANGICSGMAPIDAIIKERAEIYKRKSAFLEENHIECDFL